MKHECDREIIYENQENNWLCQEWDNGDLYLLVQGPLLHFHGIKIKFCPFCGYQPERSKREDINDCCCTKCDCPNIPNHSSFCSSHK